MAQIINFKAESEKDRINAIQGKRLFFMIDLNQDNGNPIPVSQMTFPVRLAHAVGVMGAIVLTRLHDLTVWAPEQQLQEDEGLLWYRMSYGVWASEMYNLYTDNSIKVSLRELRKSEILKSRTVGTDRTLWYAIDYEKIEAILAGSGDEAVGEI